MKVNRYFESHHEPNDTMFVEIDNRYRFTGRGTDWGKVPDSPDHGYPGYHLR